MNDNNLPPGSVSERQMERRIDELNPRPVVPARVSSNVFNAPVSGFQQGDNNQMDVNNVINTFSQLIENATATSEQKEKAKGVLGEFLKHPAIVAILSSLGGEAAKAWTSP